METARSTDLWAEWLLKTRYGDSTEMKRRTLEGLAPIRDKVIENAQLKPGDTLLDVGTGDGFIGFGAMEKVGADGKVIFSDISAPLLEVCREYAREANLEDRCEFLNAGATDLSGIASNSIDALTTRSVLIYVADKPRALSEFHRVLKPAGWLSIFEPVSKLTRTYLDKKQAYFGYDIAPLVPLFERMKERFSAERAAQDTMGDFDDRDMIRMITEAGFPDLQMQLDVRLGNHGYGNRNWDFFYNMSPNPLAPSLRVQAEQTLTAEEQQQLIDHMRPLVESDLGRICQVGLFLTARKADA